jgi:type IV secretion system protein VirB4
MLNKSVDAREVSVASQLPYSQQISPTIVVTEAGDYTATLQVHGISFNTMTNAEIDGLNRTWLSTINTALASPNHAMWTHIVRSRQKDMLNQNEYDNCFSADFVGEYNESLKSQDFFTNRLYISPVYRLAGTKADRFGMKFASKRGEDYMALHEQARDAAQRYVSILGSALKRYHTRQLSSYATDDGLATEIGEFYARLLNHRPCRVQLRPANLSRSLPMATLDFGEETVRITNGSSTTFAAVMSMVAPYTCETLDAKVHEKLLTANFEFVLSQSFTTMPRDSAERMLKAQQNRIESTAANEIQVKDIQDALTNLQANKFKMMEHEWILVIYGSSLKELNNHVNDAITLMNDKSIQIARENGGPMIATYFSIFPGAFNHGRIRAMPISSLNMSKFFPLHNYPTGNRRGSQWGKPVLVLSTESRNPYYLNFHVSRDRMVEQGIQLQAEDDEDQIADSQKQQRKEVGNYYIVGGTGAGKTTLKVALRAALKRKENDENRQVKVFTLDKDFGEEIVMRAMGAQYFILEPGTPSGINPFQWPDSDETREMIYELAKWAAQFDTSYVLKPSETIDLKKAIASVFDLPRADRRFGSLVHYLPSHETEFSLHQLLMRWCHNEDDPRSAPYGWVLDSPVDRLNLNDGHAYGFDTTAVIKLPYAKTPLMRLITEKILRSAAGTPHVIDIAEAWALLADPLMGKFIDDKSRTIRKQDGIIGLDTQNAEDIADSQLGQQFLNQFPTSFILPNSKARASVYIDKLGLTPREFDLIRTGSVGDGSVLVKKGNESIMAKMNLAGMDNMLSVLSASTDNVMICRECIREFGLDPKEWLPRFYERRI